MGFNTPTIIRYPFEEITFFNPSALLARMNLETVPPMLPIQSRTVNIMEPMPEVVARLLAAKAEKSPGGQGGVSPAGNGAGGGGLP